MSHTLDAFVSRQHPLCPSVVQNTQNPLPAGVRRPESPPRLRCPRAGGSVIAVALLAVAVAVAACGGETATHPSPGPAARATAESAELLDAGRFAAAIRRSGVVLINVHVPYEGELAGTDRFIRFDRIDARSQDLPPRSSRLAIYCRTGRMSAIAGKALSRLGYGDVIELRGGMLAWERSGRTLRTSARRGAG